MSGDHNRYCSGNRVETLSDQAGLPVRSIFFRSSLLTRKFDVFRSSRLTSKTRHRERTMNTTSDALMLIFITVPWLAGIALAKGTWATAFAIFCAPYAWYLVIERALVAVGWAGA